MNFAPFFQEIERASCGRFSWVEAERMRMFPDWRARHALGHVLTITGWDKHNGCYTAGLGYATDRLGNVSDD